MAIELLQVDDLVKSGDIDRLTVVMKRLCLTVLGLLYKDNKYAI